MWKKSRHFAPAAVAIVSYLAPAVAAAPSVADAIVDAIQKSHFIEARNLASEALKRNPKEIQFWNLLGIAQTELHAPLEARKAFSRGLELAPDSISLNENMGFLYYREADYVSAKKYLARAVSLGSNQPGVRFSLAASRLRTGDPDHALDQLRALETDLGNLSGYWEERGRAELARDPALAETSFEHALSIEPDSAAALNLAAQAAEAQGLDEKALSYLIQARRTNPDDVDTLAHFGAVCLRRDLGPDARDALEKAHRLQPSNNTVLYLLARADVALQNWRQAYDLFQEFSARQPVFAPAYYAMGWLSLRLNDSEDARRKLEQCLKLEPRLVDARVDLAQLELDDGHSEDAERLLDTALATQPDHAAANVALAGILLRRGDLDAAQSCLEKAIAKNPSLAPAHYRLAIVLQRKHLSDQAQREQSLAADLNTKATQAGKTQLRLVLPEGTN